MNIKICPENKVINPKTNIKICPENKVLNPKTNSM